MESSRSETRNSPGGGKRTSVLFLGIYRGYCRQHFYESLQPVLPGRHPEPEVMETV